MATQIDEAFPVDGNQAHAGKASKEPQSLIDEQGNILPYPGYKVEDTQEKYCRPSLISRLATAASLSKEIPTAGEYAIRHSKEPQPDLEIPPECHLYDEVRPFVLGKLNKAALDLPEPAEPVPLPQSVIEALNALEQAEKDRINKSQLGEDNPSEATPPPVKTFADEGVQVALGNRTKNPPPSPSKGGRKSASSSLTSSPRPAPIPRKPIERPKTPKSPAGGDSTGKKATSSPRSALNAKTDVEKAKTKISAGK